MGAFERIAMAALAIAFAAGCAPAPTKPPQAAAIEVFAGIVPQKYFVDRISGGRVAVSVLLPPGRTEHTYEPTPQQITELGAARSYFEMGLPFEIKILAKVAPAYPGIDVVDTRKDIKLMPMTAVDADEPPDEAAAVGGLDPHIWMDPILVKTQSRTIADALEKLDGAHAQEYEKNLAAFDADLDRVDARIRQALAPLKSREFLVFHPAFGYFAARYDLVQIPIEIEGKEPGARQLTEIIDRANRDAIKVIFVQPQFSKASAEAIAEAIGGAVISLDALAYDYIANLEDIADKIAKALAQEKPSGGAR